MLHKLEEIGYWATHLNKKRIYEFHEGGWADKDLLGVKGSYLCEMTRLGLHVPSGFVITTETCNDFFRENKVMPPDFEHKLISAVHDIERRTGRTFGEKSARTFPLLLSVRKAAPMLDTILNVGINESVCQIIASKTNNMRFALDTYRRFLHMFGVHVLGMNNDLYENIITNVMEKYGIKNQRLFTSTQLDVIISEFKKIATVPDDPYVQLKMAIEASFCSWFSPKYIKYRQANNIPTQAGVGLIIQSMVYGNMNSRSGTGVAFSRNPSTGEDHIYGEYLPQAEGEDVVTGMRSAQALKDMVMLQPAIYRELVQCMKTLEKHFRDMQEVEFTIEDGTLFILETRVAKRTPLASVRVAIDMVNSELLTEREAILRLDPEQMYYFRHKMISASAEIADNVLGSGLVGAPGCVSGIAVFSNEACEQLKKSGQTVILVKSETCGDDIAAINAADGVLTMYGGLTSYASVMCRSLGKCCVAGASVCGMKIDPSSESVWLNNKVCISKGQLITIDGSSGRIVNGTVPTVEGELDKDYIKLLTWADKYKRMLVFATTESKTETSKAVELGADGVGLLKLEKFLLPHPDRLDSLRGLHIATSDEERRFHLNKLEKWLLNDLQSLYSVLSNKHLTIRFLDFACQEWLPRTEHEIKEFARRINMDFTECFQRIKFHASQVNPALGVRGCRSAVVWPEIIEMQTRAIMAAGLGSSVEKLPLMLSLMVPMVSSTSEVETLVPIINHTAEQCFKVASKRISYRVGTMLETPRSCLIADSLSSTEDVSFVTFDTNELTQFVWGMGKDECTKDVMKNYLKRHVLKTDPFETIDQNGVGAFMGVAAKRARHANRDVKLGVVGDHTADPKSVFFFDKIGVDYISCSPQFIPSAKVAAAQSHIKQASRRKLFSEERTFFDEYQQEYFPYIL